MPPLTPLKLQRLRSGKLQIEVATASGVPRARLSELECGRVQPRPGEAEKLAAALGTTADELFPVDPSTATERASA